MNSVYISSLVMVLATILPHFGITLGNDALTNVVQGLVVIIGGFIIYFRHSTVVTAARQAGVKGV